MSAWNYDGNQEPPKRTPSFIEYFRHTFYWPTFYLILAIKGWVS